MERNLALEFVRITEAAAIAASAWVGRGDKHAADQAAVDAMRTRFNQIDFSGTVVIGEGSKDEAPMLYTGEKLGSSSGPAMLDIAVDPLECTDSVAYGRPNALAVIATGPTGSLLHAPDTYMDKIAVGPDAAEVIDLDAPVEINLKKIAKALKKPIADVTVSVLDRERHKDLINQVRSSGARVRLITDGDVASAIATCLPDSGIDVVMGLGGSTEAVLAAAAVKTLGGALLCRFKPRNESDTRAIHEAGIVKLDKLFGANDLAKGNKLSFTATGVIDGPLLRGVSRSSQFIVTHSVAMRSFSGTIRYLTTHHRASDHVA